MTGRRHHRLAHLDGGRDHLHGGLRRHTATPAQLRADTAPVAPNDDRGGRAQPNQSPAISSCPTPIRGWPPWPAPSPPASRAPPTPIPTPTTRSRPSRPGWPTTSATPPTSRRCPPGPTPSTQFLFGNRLGFCEQISTATGGHAAVARHPGPRGGRLRARLLQPDHRPLRRAGQGRPRLGAGVVPRLRLAELRPHRRRPAGQPVARLGPGHALPAGCSPTSRWIPIGIVAVAGRRGRSRCVGGGGGARPPGPTRSPPTSSGAGPGAGSRRLVTRRCRPTAYGLADGRRRGTAPAWIAVNPIGRSATPTAGVEPVGRADRRRRCDFGPPLPTGRRRRRRPGDGPHDREHGQRLVERGPGGQQRAVGHQLAGPAEGRARPRRRSPRR